MCIYTLVELRKENKTVNTLRREHAFLSIDKTTCRSPFQVKFHFFIILEISYCICLDMLLLMAPSL